MNVTPRSTQRFSVASDSVASTSPYTGVNAIAPKPIALTLNSSPKVTVGTAELVAFMSVPSPVGGSARSWRRRPRRSSSRGGVTSAAVTSRLRPGAHSDTNCARPFAVGQLVLTWCELAHKQRRHHEDRGRVAEQRLIGGHGHPGDDGD